MASRVTGLLASVLVAAAVARAAPGTTRSEVVHPHDLYASSCGPSDATGCTVADAQNVTNYLQSLGTTDCTVSPGAGTQMALNNGCYIYGVSLANGDSTSYCQDVASAANYIIQHCDNNGLVRGNAAANGNGNLIVQIRGDPISPQGSDS